MWYIKYPKHIVSFSSPVPPATHTATEMASSQYSVPSPRRVAEPGTRETQIDEVPPIKLLDGEVTVRGELAFAGGTHCELWRGQWKKGGGIEETGETVGSSLTTLILADLTL